jgi:hypothetical protein
MKWVSVLTLAAIIPAVVAAQDSNARTPSLFAYESVAHALESMRVKDGVKISMQSGWTVIFDPPTFSQWSFTPPGHSAHPAVAHRWLIWEGGAVFVQSNIRCEAPKPACDDLAVEFSKLDDAMRESIKRNAPGR